MRADQLLLARELASSRSQAQRLIAAGVQWRANAVDNSDSTAWKRIGKNSDELPADAHIELLDAAEARYVSRGGLKLEAALKAVGVDVHGAVCLDVGQSTGGFTDCLLQHGARQVVGVDVGSGQLHPAMRADARVHCIENVNARNLSATDFIAICRTSIDSEGQFSSENDGASTVAPDHDADSELDEEIAPDSASAFVPAFDLIVADLSFISQTLVLPAVLPFLKPGGRLLTLVKPQFELQPGQVGKGGIVRDDAMYSVVELRLRSACAELGLRVTHWFDSPIAGGDGNREFFISAVHSACA